jgi:hypothetical protein
LIKHLGRRTFTPKNFYKIDDPLNPVHLYPVVKRPKISVWIASNQGTIVISFLQDFMASWHNDNSALIVGDPQGKF